GLADVMGALPRELAAKGLDVRLVIPKYSKIGQEWKDKMKEVVRGQVNLAWRQQYYGVEEVQLDGVTCYFIDNEYYFKRDKLYGFGDDAERFAYFCRAVLTMLPKVGFHPDVLHCNDWHTGLMGVYLKEDFQHDPWYQGIKVVYTIHNLKYQGIYPPQIMRDIIGLPQELFDNGNLECDGCVNYMKSGMVYADHITTVSPSYAQEITYPYFGEGLDGYIRDNDEKVTGIINGLDVDVYNPETDPYIKQQYSVANARAGKRANKDALRAELGLRIKRGVPMIAMVTRLVEDKGLDLVTRIMDELVDDDVQLVVVGTGDAGYENAFRELARRHPTKVSVNIMFNEALAHKVYAAADMFLMPSRYEPCGLSQLIALRYGAIPIVRETGGLKDTVHPFDKYTKQGNGLTFPNFNAHELLFTTKRAMGYYEDSALWDVLVRNAMNSDYSWDRSAEDYKNLYEKILQQ
ncbi:MAG: glycogen synthase GlgA, partial [Megasphaera sp.]|uniref:glycogen synthase GlgA n=1 Tax=Megasphaera sp. TaxID=2023260 RepID=UPI003F071694